MTRLSENSLQERAAAVQFLLMDVDGVLTDGTISFDAEGRETKRFHTHDGHGIRMAQRAGLYIGLITGRKSAIVTRRAEDLDIGEVHQKIIDKGACYAKIREKLGLDHSAFGYMGDDLIDVPVMSRVGFSAAPCDAVTDAREAAHWIAKRPGGGGAVRDWIEFILRARGDWDEVTARYRN